MTAVNAKEIFLTISVTKSDNYLIQILSKLGVTGQLLSQHK